MQNITIKIQNGGMVVSLDEPKDAAERRVQVEDIMLAWNFHAPKMEGDNAEHNDKNTERRHGGKPG